MEGRQEEEVGRAVPQDLEELEVADIKRSSELLRFGGPYLLGLKGCP